MTIPRLKPVLIATIFIHPPPTDLDCPMHSTPIQSEHPTPFQFTEGTSIAPPASNPCPNNDGPVQPEPMSVPEGQNIDQQACHSEPCSKLLSYSAMNAIVQGMSTPNQVLNIASKPNLGRHESVKYRLIPLENPQIGHGDGFKCQESNKIFKNKTSLSNHVYSKHPDSRPHVSAPRRVVRFRSPAASLPKRPSLDTPSNPTAKPAQNSVVEPTNPQPQTLANFVSYQDLLTLLMSKKTKEEVLSWADDKNLLDNQAVHDRLVELSTNQAPPKPRSVTASPHACPSCPKNIRPKAN